MSDSEHLGRSNERVYECSDCGATIAIGYDPKNHVRTYYLNLRCVRCDQPFGIPVEGPSDRREKPATWGRMYGGDNGR